MSYFSGDEFPGKPLSSEAAEARLESIHFSGQDRMNRREATPCTRCGGTWELWGTQFPTTDSPVVIRHLDGKVGLTLVFDEYRWAGEFRQDLVLVIRGASNAMHPLDSAPKHGHRGVSVRRG